MKGGNDVFFQDACGFERISDAVLCAVALYPDFAPDDVQRHKSKVDVLTGAFPSSSDEQIPITLGGETASLTIF